MTPKELVQYAKKIGYRVEPSGDVIGTSGYKILASAHCGYRQISVRMPAAEGRKRSRALNVHRLQAYQKYGDAIFETGVVVRHLNGDSLDNSWDNILIGTQSENLLDMSSNARVSKALHAASFVRRFSNEQILEIIRLRNIDKLTCLQIAEKMGIKSKGHISEILSGKLYSTVSGIVHAASHANVSAPFSKR